MCRRLTSSKLYWINERTNCAGIGLAKSSGIRNILALRGDPPQGILRGFGGGHGERHIKEFLQSCVSQCKHSMTSLRSVIARLVVVYLGDATVRAPGDLIALSQRALDGELPLRPCITSTTDREDELIQSQKDFPLSTNCISLVSSSFLHPQRDSTDVTKTNSCCIKEVKCNGLLL